MDLQQVFGTDKPVVGMVHLLPLPGSPSYTGDFSEVKDAMIRDASRLVEGGVDGLIVENYGDAPFYADDVPKHTVAYMTVLASELKNKYDVPLGVNVLRNDALGAISVATSVGAEFIRVNIHTGARVTDQGIIEGRAHETLRARKSLNSSVKVFADVSVKHSAKLGERGFKDEVNDAIERGKADAIVVSGKSTGGSVNIEELKKAVEITSELGGKTPVLAGSGVDKENVSEILGHADGAIVGTWFKKNSVTTNPVNTGRVKELIGRVK
ncbi:MAG: BtpA/SgcQ family protein [Halobacteria archaeon]|nr:BtpA/SgcQ family protein [Halobacteria archaeon]